MASPLPVIMVGCGGYGAYILRQLLSLQEERLLRVVAAVDPQPQATCLQLLQSQDIPLWEDLEPALDALQPALLVVVSPIHLHAQHSIAALRRGIAVCCEKPAAARLADAQAMAAAADENKQFCAIGFQWSFSQAVQDLKRDIASGRLGRPLRCASAVLWARSAAYYQRNDWAGRWHSGGVFVGDSILSNATAHHLHHWLYLLGPANTAATPQRVDIAAGRANPIDTYDTAVVDAWVGEVAIRHAASHAVSVEWPPFMSAEFSEGHLHYGDGHGFVFRATNGHTLTYGDPEDDPAVKLRAAVAAINDGTPIACDVRCASTHLALIEDIYQALPNAAKPPQGLCQREGDGAAAVCRVDGLEHQLLNCWANGAPPPTWLSRAQVR